MVNKTSMASITSEVATQSPDSRLKRFVTAFWSLLRQLVSRPLSFLGLVVVLTFILMAVFGSTVAPHKFDEIIKGAARQSPSATYLFGTDKLGRDVFSRVLWGAREVITIPGIATSIAVMIGAIIGMATAYFGGWFDEIISRLLDSLLAIPALLLALVMLGVIGPSPIGIVIVIVLLWLHRSCKTARRSQLVHPVP